MHRIVLDKQSPRPQLPPYQEIDHPVIREAAAAWDATRAELRQRKQDTVELEQTRPQAEWADAEAAEAARAAGKSEPRRTHIQAHDKKLDEARHEEKVATLAEARAFDALRAAIDEHQAEWLANATDEVEAVAQTWRVAIATLAELNRQLARAHRSRNYASNGDPVDGPGVPTGAIEVGIADLQGIDVAQGTPRSAKGHVAVEHVLAELARMGYMPSAELPEPELERQSVSIMGHARSVPVPLTDEQKAERAARAGARRAERERQRAEVDALIHGGDA